MTTHTELRSYANGKSRQLLQNFNADFTDISHNPNILKVARKTQAFFTIFWYFFLMNGRT